MNGGLREWVDRLVEPCLNGGELQTVMEIDKRCRLDAKYARFIAGRTVEEMLAVENARILDDPIGAIDARLRLDRARIRAAEAWDTEERLCAELGTFLFV